MKLNTPLPQPLPKECVKAAKIFKSFVDSGNNGLDGVIPRHVLENAKGFAIFTIVKAGFLFSARAGSGVVIAKLPDGSWSAPSAIGTAGLGFGGQAGAEVTDFLIVLNSWSAVRSFMSAGSLTLGGNMSIAIGPLGRNGEASGSLNTKGKVSAMYSYSKTKGLFGGVSIEGSVIVERQDANSIAYQSDVTAQQLLSGAVDCPEWASALVKTLEMCTGLPGGRKWIDEAGPDLVDGRYAFGNGVESPGPGGTSPRRRSIISPPSWGRKKSSGSYFPQTTPDPDALPKDIILDGTATRTFQTQFDSDFSLVDTRPTYHPKLSLRQSPPHQSSFSPDSPFNDLPPFPVNNPSKSMNGLDSAFSDLSLTGSGTSANRRHTSSFENNGRSLNTNHSRAFSDDRNQASRPHIAPKAGLTTPLHDGVGRAIALYDFKAVQPGDLSFKKGQIITIVKKSLSTNDWWTGKLDGNQGIFPANFVEVV